LVELWDLAEDKQNVNLEEEDWGGLGSGNQQNTVDFSKLVG
jgi:hypothetical protein